MPGDNSDLLGVTFNMTIVCISDQGKACSCEQVFAVSKAGECECVHPDFS